MTTPTELRALLAEAKEYVDKKHTHYVALSGSEGTVVKLDCERCDLLARITAALSEKDEGGWLPIETAPREGKFLVYMPTDDLQQIQAAKFALNNKGQAINIIGNHFAFDMSKPTHWQPLPSPPESQL